MARQVALLPSFELGRRELARRGLSLDIKVVHRITNDLGAQMLTTRTRDLEQGRKCLIPSGQQLRDKNVGVVIDGTLQGFDELMELLTWHLHRLGAHDAKSVTFLSDGAPWIWDRLDWFHAKIGLNATKAHRVLDWCHGLHHVSLALEALKPKDEVRQRIFSRLRRHLRAGGSTSCYPSFVRVPKVSRRRQKYGPRSVTRNVMLHT